MKQKSQPGKFRRYLFPLLAIFSTVLLASTSLSQAAPVSWIPDADEIWSHPAPWSTGMVPGEGDDVTIDRPSADVSVSFPSGTTAIGSLLCRETPVIAGRTFGFPEAATLGGASLIDGGRMTRTTLVADTKATVLAAPEPAGVIDIFIGGLGDHETGPVTDYKDALSSTPGRTVAYFRQNQVKEAIAFAKANRHDGEALNIIAHSWGADAAVRVAKGVDGKVDNLVGIDPVGKPLKKLFGKRGSRPQNVANVVTVYGQPSQRAGSDTGETVGKLVGGQPRAFKKQADATIRVDAHHTAFKHMLEAKGPDGRSALDIVDRSYDARRN